MPILRRYEDQVLSEDSLQELRGKREILHPWAAQQPGQKGG